MRIFCAFFVITRKYVSDFVKNPRFKNQLRKARFTALNKIIKIVYGMNDEPIYNDEVVSLYEKVLRQLNKRSENGLEKPGKKIRAQVEPSTMQVKPLNGKFQSVSAPPSLLQSTNIQPNSPNLQKLPTH